MAPHTITPAVGVMYRCKAKAGLRRSPRVSTHEHDSKFSSAWHHSKRRRRWVGVKCSTRNEHRDPKCSSARHLRIVQEDTGVCSEGATCAWMVADEAFGCTRAFFTMWQFSRQLVCRGRPEPSLGVNDISWIHWSKHPSEFTPPSSRPRSTAKRLLLVQLLVGRRKPSWRAFLLWMHTPASFLRFSEVLFSSADVRSPWSNSGRIEDVTSLSS
ncbi:uncharacterized protein TNCV_61991 [Trichonephila clavipes]|nr:uncharacterized protein TNCV_61991 [Trichonephila clavipes]